jgi:hypothetical protein
MIRFKGLQGLPAWVIGGGPKVGCIKKALTGGLLSYTQWVWPVVRKLDVKVGSVLIFIASFANIGTLNR